jgi:hypothetical protein
MPPPPQTEAAALDAADTRLRDEALVLLGAGRFDEAEASLKDLAARHPSDPVLGSLLGAARSAREQSQSTTTRLFAGASPVVLEAPPWVHTVAPDAAASGAGQPAPRFVKVSETRNSITDESEWFARNDLRIPGVLALGPVGEAIAVRVGLAVAAGPGDASATAAVEIAKVPTVQEGLPMTLPAGYGSCGLVFAIADDEHYVLVYGPNAGEGRYLALVDRKSGALTAFFDFDRYLMPPSYARGEGDFVRGSVSWAELRDGALYVMSGNRTYARSSRGHNAYVTKLDARTGRLLWRSDPLTANASNFVIWKGFVITGYGFTAERDFLYALDGGSGAVVRREPLKKGPEFLVEKGGKLYVRTYSLDYVFALE